MDKKHQKSPQKGFFPPFATPEDFFSKIGLCPYPCGALTSCKKLEKSLALSLRYFKTDRQTNGQTMDMGDYMRPPRVNPGTQMRILFKIEFNHFLALCTK